MTDRSVDAPEQLVLARPPLGRRWMIPGGEEDEASVTLNVIVSDTDGVRTRRYSVTLPLSVSGVCELEVGTPVVEER